MQIFAQSYLYVLLYWVATLNLLGNGDGRHGIGQKFISTKLGSML